MLKKRFLGVVFYVLIPIIAKSQNFRLNTHNNITWLNAFTTVKFSKKNSLHAEFQWRRSEFLSDKQQNLFRVGLNHHLNPNILLRIGYANAETFPYGEYPLNALGRDFTEHRIYEMIQLNQKESKVAFLHRFMLEQRWVGRYSNPLKLTEDEFPLLHRARYMFRIQLPFNDKKTSPYIALYDEIFIGFGKNVNANVFDQNRIGAILGFPINKTLKSEIGFMNQTLQYGRLINGKNTFQYNNGIILSTFINIDAIKK
jgi:hypothetical protein